MASSIVESLVAQSHVHLEKNMLYESTDASSLWDKFATSYKLDDSIRQDISGELASAVKWQGSSTSGLSNPLSERVCLQLIPINTHPMHQHSCLQVSLGNNQSWRDILLIPSVHDKFDPLSYLNGYLLFYSDAQDSPVLTPTSGP